MIKFIVRRLVCSYGRRYCHHCTLPTYVNTRIFICRQLLLTIFLFAPVSFGLIGWALRSLFVVLVLFSSCLFWGVLSSIISSPADFGPDRQPCFLICLNGLGPIDARAHTHPVALDDCVVICNNNTLKITQIHTHGRVTQFKNTHTQKKTERERKVIMIRLTFMG